MSDDAAGLPIPKDALAALPPLREVIARHGLAAKKSLGQNFLLDGNLLDRIARVPGSLAGATVYEVGPGPGGLTRALLRAGANVVAVERDDRALPALAELAEAAPGRLSVLGGDALKQDEAALLPPGTHVVANLPYNIGTALFVRWLTTDAWPPWWATLTLMFQKEVAQRIVAAPDTSAYGRLSVLAQWRTLPKIALDVPRQAFTPPPSITSSVVHVRPVAAPTGVSVRTLETLTAAAFGQRRKMLRASLRGLAGGPEALERCGIDAARRAETLSVAEFVEVARSLDASR
ncbi:16S rRNA (adenine(1518)-N(6)/adenine(1519)-N(6))-dimethyltransferase RsmA [Glacieibacterium sp.]|uniref:16S rRNA (adenine(1518)-N(6)/adenine(1519)-N(6))- dimethyltransferase RsmA n=1 Tax=Glacieibacterium sp. TaxID=2860237 RepID=UPI003B004F05